MMSNPKSEELLPPAAADCAAGVRLEKSEEINIINRLGRPTHPKEKSVLRSGATPERGGELAKCLGSLTFGGALQNGT
jgi:hypothetical protein